MSLKVFFLTIEQKFPGVLFTKENTGVLNVNPVLETLEGRVAFKQKLFINSQNGTIY